MARVIPTFVVALLLALTTVAKASEVAPDPITATQVEQYAERLRLSQQQRVALAGMHLEYAREYESLRVGEISELLGQLSKAPWRGATLNAWPRVFDRIVAIDNRFFDQAQTILSDDQIALLPRVRQMRERDRLMQGPVTLYLRSVPPDLVLLVATLKLGDAEMAAIDSKLAAYESAINDRLRDVVKQQERAFRDLTAQYEAAGITESRLGDEAHAETLARLNADFASVNEGATRDLRASLRALTREHYQAIRAALPPDAAHEFRTAYFRTAYGFLSLQWLASNYSMTISPARREKLSEQQRLDLDAALARFDKDLNTVLERYADYEDGLYRQFTLAEMFNDPARSGEHTKQRYAVEQDVMDARKAAMLSVDAIAPREAGREIPQEDLTAGDIARPSMYFDSSVGAGDMFVPGRLEHATVVAMRDALHIDAATANAILDHYNETFDRIQASDLTAWEQARVNSWPPNPTTSAAVEEYIAKRATALRAVELLEREVFAQLRDAADVAEDDAVFARFRDARIRALRNRTMYGGRWQGQGPGQRKDSVIDVSYLLRRRQPHVAIEPAIDAPLTEYERALTPLFVKRFDAMVAYDDGNWRYRAEVASKRQETGNASLSMPERQRELTAASERLVVEANVQIVALNDRTLESLSTLLADDALAKLRHDYERLCYPFIFNDVSFVGPFLNIALHMSDLTPQQRAQVEQLAAEYHPAYEEFCRKMIEANEPLPKSYEEAVAPKNPDVVRAHRAARERLVFDRHEMNVRTLNHLKGVLNEEQIKALGRLPDVSEFKARDYGW